METSTHVRKGFGQELPTRDLQEPVSLVSPPSRPRSPVGGRRIHGEIPIVCCVCRGQCDGPRVERGAAFVLRAGRPHARVAAAGGGVRRRGEHPIQIPNEC